MSRSYRHTPIVKSGKRRSNKSFKEHAHRVFRKRTKEELAHDNIEEILPPEKMREVSEIWESKQVYKWKEFGNFWDTRLRELTQIQVVYPYYRGKKQVKQRIRWYTQLFKEMFYR